MTNSPFFYKGDPGDFIPGKEAESVAEFTSQVRLFTALQLFKRHKLSLGKAAELAGLDREQFMVELDRYEIPMIDYDPDELEEELKRFEK
jgi:predicted HTH domain antitoxin